MKTKAAVVHSANAPFVIEEVDLADPAQNEVIVKIVASGVCHTDEVGRQGGFPAPFPTVFGHEGSGIVKEVGPGVSTLKPDDHVVISYPHCGHCEACYEGRIQHCKIHGPLQFNGKFEDGKNRIFQDGKPVSSFFGQSSFAEHAIVNINNLVKVDPELDLSYMGPLACGIMTGAGSLMNQLKPAPGDSLAVFGAGNVGLSAVIAAKLFNCNPLIAVDVVDSRLEMASQFGATHVINGRKTANVAEEIKKLTDGWGAKHVVESSGVASVMQQAVDSLSVGGTIAAVANAITFPQSNLLGKRLIGIQMGEAVISTFIPRLLRLNKLGLFPYDKMITFYDFKDINQAFEDTHRGVSIKAVLRMLHDI
jgi:aryl-alcohol dehydrogenase